MTDYVSLPKGYVLTEMREGWGAHVEISRNRVVRAWGVTKHEAVNNLRRKVEHEDLALRQRLALR